MKHFQVIQVMNPKAFEMRYEVIYGNSGTYFTICYCKTQVNASNICSALNAREKEIDEIINPVGMEDA